MYSKGYVQNECVKQLIVSHQMISVYYSHIASTLSFSIWLSGSQLCSLFQPKEIISEPFLQCRIIPVSQFRPTSKSWKHSNYIIIQ